MLHKILCFRHSEDINSCRKSYPTVIEELCHHFSLAELRKSTNNFDTNRIIGRGGYTTVYKGCLEFNGATDYTVAIKRVEKSDPTFREYFKNEIELFCQIRHPNLVPLIGFCDHKHEKILVYEYMSNGSLYDHLYDRHMEPLSWKKRLEICIGAAHGLHFLHTGAKRTVFHCCIEPHNIRLDNNMVPKLAGFGFCLQGPHFMSKPKPIQVDYITGVYGYVAPEYALHSIYTDKCDVYSFGMVLLEVVSAKKATTIISKFEESTSQGLQESIDSDLEFESTSQELQESKSIFDLIIQRISIEEIIDPTLAGKIAPECGEAFINLTKKCVTDDPNERPTIAEVELELERALLLQEEADVAKSNGDHTLLSTSIFNMQ